MAQFFFRIRLAQEFNIYFTLYSANFQANGPVYNLVGHCDHLKMPKNLLSLKNGILSGDQNNLEKYLFHVDNIILSI